MFDNEKLKSGRILDKNSQAEITLLLRTLDTTPITVDNIHLVLKLALRVILLDDNPVSVQFCWKLLDAIQGLNLSLASCISDQFGADVFEDMNDSQHSIRLIHWLLNNFNSKEIKMAVIQKVDAVVSPKGTTGQYTLDDLIKITQYLNIYQNDPELMPQGDKLKRLCDTIILSLGRFQMPDDVASIPVFLNSVEEIKQFLIRANETQPKEMNLQMLTTLYKSISECQRDAGPGLAVVLQLIEPTFITNSVRWLLAPHDDDARLVRGLNILVGWLFKWTRKPPLGEWVVAFMKGLWQHKSYHVLEQVTVERMNHMVSMLKLNAYRESISIVLFHMLCSMQHTPMAFLMAVEGFINIIPVLKIEDTVSSRACLQKIIDVSTALMERFPTYQSKYTHFRALTADMKPSENYANELNVPVWYNRVNDEVALQNVPGKVGLVNLGNTCYMNSVLQALFMIMSFRNEMLVCPFQVSPLDGLQSLFALMQFSNKNALEPPENLLAVRPPGFLPGLQHDSSEYMGYLLDMVHEQEKIQLSNHSDGAHSTPITTVQKTFGGVGVTTNRCSNCNGESVQTDMFRDIQLSFPQTKDTNSIQDLLNYYLEPEQLCGENRYWCERCEALCNAERTFQVTQTPKHLILTLKHFRYDPKSHQRAKLFQRVSYDPVITLNTSRYELCAAVVHCGPSVDSGHYYTFASDYSGIWYKLNDSWVIRTSFSELSSLKQPSTPYVLFYQRQDVQTQQPITLEALPPLVQAIVRRDGLDSRNRKWPQTPILPKHSPEEEDEDPPPGNGGSFSQTHTTNPYVY